MNNDIEHIQENVEENSRILYTYPFSHRYKTETGVIKLFNNVRKKSDIERGHTNFWYGLVIFIDALVKDRDIGFITKEPENYIHFVPVGIMNMMPKKNEIAPENIPRIDVINILKKLIKNKPFNHDSYGINSYMMYMNLPGFTPERDLYIDLLENKLDILLEEEARERMNKKVANIIYNAWYNAYSNPYNPICKRRLLNEFNEILNC